MKLCLKTIILLKNQKDLSSLPEGKLLINTINAHSYNTALKDPLFLRGEKIERTAGWDLFQYEMNKLNQKGGVCFFLGSSKKTLSLVCEKVKTVYPNIQVKTYSPPYKSSFTEEENREMINAVNMANPDLLWIGMTAPKQEKWAYEHLNELNVHCHIGTIGAVFDFFAGTVQRAPQWWQRNGLEWAYRLLKEPKRMWRRYIIGNVLFLWNILKEKNGMIMDHN